MKTQTILQIFTILSPFIFYFFSLIFVKFRYRLKPIKKYKNDSNEFEDELNRKETSKTYFEYINKFNNEKLLNRFAINGPYGSGKSYLISFLEKDIKKNGNYVIVFKAWESNEIYSPFETLILKIKKNKKEFLNIKDFSKNKFYEKIKNLWFWIKISCKFRKVVRLIIKEPKFYFKTINTYINKYDFIKHVFWEINEFLEKKKKKIYILIDEIDRCNSSDSLEFLEITNQLFENLNNIISIYAYDKKNLMATISNKMGQVKENYLNKFFNYEFDLPDKSDDYLISKIKQIENKNLSNILLQIVKEKSNNNEPIGYSLRQINIIFNQILNIKAWYINEKFSNILSTYYFVNKFYQIKELDNKILKKCLKNWKLLNMSIFDFKLIFNKNKIYVDEDENKLLFKELHDLVYLRNAQKISKFSESRLFIKFSFFEIQEFEKYFSFKDYKGNLFYWNPLNNDNIKSQNEVLFSNVEKILINLFINEKLKNENFYEENFEKDREMKNWIIKLSKLEEIPFFQFSSVNNYVHLKKTLEAINFIVDEKFVNGDSKYLKSLHKQIKDFYVKKIKKYFINSK